MLIQSREDGDPASGKQQDTAEEVHRFVCAVEVTLAELTGGLAVGVGV